MEKKLMASFFCVHKRPGSLGEEPDYGAVDPVVFFCYKSCTDFVQNSPFSMLRIVQIVPLKSNLGGFQKKGGGGWG
jgi:hypothetical protein